MYPGHWGVVHPEKPALVVGGSGERVTFGDLNERSNRLAQFLFGAGLRPGDHVALFMENNPRFHDLVWAALRSGLIVTTVNSYLTAPEAGYIIEDCGARALVTSARLAAVAAALPALIPRCTTRLMVDGTITGFDSYEDALAGQPPEPLDDEPLGDFMMYSSGTTGRPKGIRRLPSVAPVTDGLPLLRMLSELFSIDAETVYLSPAPLYHSAPFGFTTAVQMMGGTVVMMEHFDPEESLGLIERYGVTHSQWVPTMFSRLLKLPEAARTGRDLSSQRVVIHAAAPCPPAVKQAMFDWWGPIIHEYYGSTEPSGFTYCPPGEWLAHPGTVGRAFMGRIHICADDGSDLPPGVVGTIYFESDRPQFEYHNAPEQTTVDPASTTRQLGHRGRRRPGRRGRIPLPHRPGDVHDHLRWREHLSPRSRGPPRDAPQG